MLRREEKTQEEARRARRNERARERRRRARLPPNSPELLRASAADWLERIRNHMAAVFPCDLAITYPGGGAANLGQDQGEDAAHLASRTPWMIVGRFDPREVIGYAELAQGFARVEGDFLLEAAINPNRLSQIRIVFADSQSFRSEGDSVVSRIGAWGFVVGDILTELVGSDVDSPDEDSLAGRYDQSTVPMFYVFFSTETEQYRTASPWATTATVKLK